MSVTVSDLLKLPSLRQATVIGGHRGLSRIVSSISVLESTDPGVLVDNVFPAGEFFGSEIVITGFLNCLDDIDCQCANIQRLAEGGEVGLILFYVGVYLPYVDQRLIDLADQLDFVLVQMPWGQNELRYGEVISDVTECIYHDRNRGSPSSLTSWRESPACPSLSAPSAPCSKCSATSCPPPPSSPTVFCRSSTWPPGPGAWSAP